jgi:hypothetical protein
MEFDEIRRDIEEKRQIIHTPDPLPDFYTLHAERVFRPSASIALGILFLLLAVGIFAVPFLCDFEGGSLMAWLIALGPLLLAIGYFRGAGRRIRGKGKS